MAHSEPPGSRRDVPFNTPKLGPFPDRIRQILEEDRGAPKKQRHTAQRVFERIQREGYTGGSTQVTEAVRALKQRRRKVFVPLVHRPGEAQVDFGDALVNVAGCLRKLPFFVRTLPYSDAIFVPVFERISTGSHFLPATRRTFSPTFTGSGAGMHGRENRRKMGSGNPWQIIFTICFRSCSDG